MGFSFKCLGLASLWESTARRPGGSRRGVEARRAERVRLLLSLATSRWWGLSSILIARAARQGRRSSERLPGPPWKSSTSMKQEGGGSCLAVLVPPHGEDAGDSGDGDERGVGSRDPWPCMMASGRGPRGLAWFLPVRVSVRPRGQRSFGLEVSRPPRRVRAQSGARPDAARDRNQLRLVASCEPFEPLDVAIRGSAALGRLLRRAAMRFQDPVREPGRQRVVSALHIVRPRAPGEKTRAR